MSAKTVFCDQQAVNTLLDQIGIRARRDYLAARRAKERGAQRIFGLPPEAVMLEIRKWLETITDEDTAEAACNWLDTVDPKELDSCQSFEGMFGCGEADSKHGKGKPKRKKHAAGD